MDLFLLYVFTRLDNINFTAALVFIGGCILSAGMLFFSALEQEKPPLAPRWILTRVIMPCLAVLLLVPSQKDAMVIVGGTTLISFLKSDQAAVIASRIGDGADNASRVAGKSLLILEKYLDEQLVQSNK